ncbi:tRNA lysidine(34) synthetase TilS [Tahibacter amnicola]|uniref:tRNA(Ile)-lysidine synthetase n=1 Tax=Tahibacter amnicola TaxID=2976241 RepID=A0ABY6BMT4_9GAMM|nr:tRNA lysidine(34) synthetase TilS [Tahibacter amnicola]UXI69881.1 tRNA lysidine(34) synthetase TilS [Tahibacter amnicola]
MKPTDLTSTLAASMDALPSGPVVVALSGGMDSTVLLHALAALPAARERGLSAIHIDHGLHPRSAAWAETCRDLAAGRDVPFSSVRVAVVLDAGQGLEAAAREARMAAITRQCAPGSIIALAHHRDDQTETVLLKLVRGAGADGLRGMRPFDHTEGSGSGAPCSNARAMTCTGTRCRPA